MTTTVTVTTGDHPASVAQNDHIDVGDKAHRVIGWTTTTTFVPPNSKVDFHVTDVSSISVSELALDADGLLGGEALGSEAS